jgi:hypothetical protein
MKEFTNTMKVFMKKLKSAKNIKAEVMSNLKNLIYLDGDKALDEFEWCLMVSFFDEIVKFSEALLFIEKIYDKVEYATVIKLILYSMYDNSKEAYDDYELDKQINETKSFLEKSIAFSSRDDFSTIFYNLSVLYNLKYKCVKIDKVIEPRIVFELIYKVIYPLNIIDQGELVKYEDIDEILSNI